MSGRAPIRAAGVVVLDRTGLVLAVERPGRSDVSLPKGKLHKDEPAPVAAVRECHEETGTRVRLEAPVGACHYTVDGVPKRVRYWRATALEDTGFVPGDEVAAVRHIDPAVVADELTYPLDADMVRRAIALGTTTPLVVLRHAESVKRGAWAGSGAQEADDDSARPLAPDGLRQADRLVPLLTAYGITDVRTSGSRRCRQTVEPYAAATGIVAVRDPRLSEEGHTDDAAATVAATRAAASSPEATLLCTHRPVLQAVVRSLLDHLGAVDGLDLPELLDPRLAPAAMLVLHRDGRGRVVAVEHHHVR